MSVSIDHSFSIHEFFLFQEYYPSLFSKFPRDRDSSSSYFFGDLARIARARKKGKTVRFPRDDFPDNFKAPAMREKLGKLGFRCHRAGKVGASN